MSSQQHRWHLALDGPSPQLCVELSCQAPTTNASGLCDECSGTAAERRGRMFDEAFEQAPEPYEPNPYDGTYSED